MLIETLSVFPEMFFPLNVSIPGRAQECGALKLVHHDLRDWTKDRHRTTDDEPYGGGQGLLMKCEPLFDALDDLEGRAAPAKPHVVFFAPWGEVFDQGEAAQLAGLEHIICVCGRYEGFDERAYSRADSVISLGDFVLSGAELAAMCLIDATCRLLPGVLGDEGSAVDESFAEGLLEYPQYTRPASVCGLDVPQVLLSGDHAAVDRWRRKQSLLRTARLRPDLLKSAMLGESDVEFLATSGYSDLLSDRGAEDKR